MKLKKEKTEKREQVNKKKKAVIVITVIFVIFLIAGVTLFFVIRGNSTGKKGAQVPPAMEGMEGDIISASGLTSVGMQEERLEIDFLETELYVEESYLSVGDEVEAGTKVFQISQETLQSAEQELENKVTETLLAYRQGVIDYETGMLEAESTYQKASVNQSYAQAEYESAVAEAAQTVEDLQEQVEEAGELVEEYEKSINEDFYREYYQVDELYDDYYEHFTLLMSFYEKWDVEALEDLYGNAASSQSSVQSGAGGEQGAEMSGAEGASAVMGVQAGSAGMGGSAQGNAGSSDNEQKLSVYNLLDELVTQEGEAYKTALENYETAKEQAAAGLEEAKSELAVLEEELIQAQTDYEKQVISCKADYEATLAESENAQIVYDTAKQSLEETLEALKDEEEEAKENQTLFEEALGDGYFYTEKAGTIVMNGVNADTYLSGDVLVAAYSNPETVTISAQVGQSDIAAIAIGDEAYVVIDGYGNYQGAVTEINPVTQAESRSSITYQVTVTLEGDISTLESNLTAYVYFGEIQTLKEEELVNEGNVEK